MHNPEVEMNSSAMISILWATFEDVLSSSSEIYSNTLSQKKTRNVMYMSHITLMCERYSGGYDPQKKRLQQ